MSLRKAIFWLIFTKTVFAYHQSGSNVTLLTATNFYHLVDNENIWVVNFYSSKTNRNRNLAKEFSLSADILKGVARFGSIDMEDDVKVAKNFSVDIKRLPIIKFYGILNERRSKEYTGPKLAEDLVESVLTSIMDKVKKELKKKLPEDLIVDVTDENFDKIITKSKEPWMVLFYAPWCLHCKELKPIWSLAASSLQKRIKCASIDATVNKKKAEEYGIQEYPTIKLFPFERKSPNHVFDYNQERSVDSIVDWALEKLSGPDIVQITSSEVFQKQCTEKNLCIISVLPSIIDCPAFCRNKYLHILKQLGEKYKRHGWGWVWTEAGDQIGLESVLEIGGSGYPALLVLNPAKMKYSVFKGAFTKDKIDEFLVKLAKVKAIRVAEDLVGKIVTVEVWDGRDLDNEYSEELYFHDMDEL